jgi:hypothetical protein
MRRKTDVASSNNKRTKVKFFVSYAHKNQALSDAFTEQLLEILGPSKKFEYKLWKDSALVVGEDWKQQILTAKDECDFGLLLLSPAFLNSEFIVGQELPRFVGDKRAPSIPVLLAKVDFRLHDLKGLEALQIFRYRGKRYTDFRSYAECKNGNPRHDFVFSLFESIETKLAASASIEKSISDATAGEA